MLFLSVFPHRAITLKIKVMTYC